MSHIFDYRVCPTIGAINIDIKLISQIPTLPHYTPIRRRGGWEWCWGITLIGA